MVKIHQLKVLLKDSVFSIPFNLLLGFLIGLYLINQQAQIGLVGLWYFFLVTISIIRIIYSLLKLKNERYLQKPDRTIFVFTILTFITATIWGCSYFLFLPVTFGKMSEAIVVLFLGGMCVGSLSSLSVILPAFYAFLLPVFLPLIVYNYLLMTTNRSIMATMFLFFLIGLVIFAKISSRLWEKVFRLSQEKDKLIQDLKQSNTKLKINSITDSLTGLYNRRYFDETILKELNRSRRNQLPMSLVMLDIDNFKQINDKYGHPEGDYFLNYVAKFLRSYIRRANDILFRIGGDEFAIIIVNSELEEGKLLLDTMIERFNKDKILTKYKKDNINPEMQVTVSIGLVWVPSTFKKGAEQIVVAADNALYKAKQFGKNQIVSTTIM